jgi:hypothetical protein
MKQEDKELLLKDLCARLSYKPWVWFRENWETNPNFKGCQSQLRLYHLEYIVKDMDITLKPYLRLMSSMTEEEREEFRKLKQFSVTVVMPNGISRIKPTYIVDLEDDGDGLNHLYDWLNAHHFDYRGLIEKGLALEAPKDMYNEKR